MRVMNDVVIAQFRSGSPMRMPRGKMLLSTTGRRTGQTRTTPMMFARVGQRLTVVASNSGAVRHPQWYLNLIADPAVTVEIGTERHRPRATVVGAAGNPPVGMAAHSCALGAPCVSQHMPGYPARRGE